MEASKVCSNVGEKDYLSEIVLTVDLDILKLKGILDRDA